jgi:predicted glycoside hydrolase/deacetylase ChbG (UPF0249 family)
LRGHREGVVTSCSVVAIGPAFAATIGWLQDAPDLGIGLHLAAVGEDPPLLSPPEIPTLVDRNGQFPLSWRRFLQRTIAGRVDPADLRREFAAQAQRMFSVGITPTHVDTHQHLHLWPLVRDVVLALARELGIGAIRVPRSAGRTLRALAVNRLASRLSRRALSAGLRFPTAFAGLEESGRLDVDALQAILDRLSPSAAGGCELVCHPGEADDPARERYRWGFLWAEELSLLTSHEAREAIRRRGFTLGNFRSLLASVREGT